MSDHEVRELLDRAKSISEATRELGYKTFDARVHALLKDKADKLGIELSHKKRYQFTYTEDQLRAAVDANYSFIDTLRALGLTEHTSNYRSIQKQIKQLEIDTSHFSIGKSSKQKTGRSFEEVFVLNSSIPRTSIRVYALRFNVHQYKCAECEIPAEYNSKPITLELDHINGDCHDNRVNNLRWLCPNCHSQTDTHRNKKRVVLPPRIELGS